MSYVVALVEDDDAIRDELRDVLSARGMRVVAAPHGAAALDEVNRGGTRPSILVVDLMTPVMSGWELLDAQAGEPLLAGVPVVVITAYDPCTHALPATVRVIFKKPFSLRPVLEAIQGICSDLDRRPH